MFTNSLLLSFRFLFFGTHYFSNEVPETTDSPRLTTSLSFQVYRRNTPCTFSGRDDVGCTSVSVPRVGRPRREIRNPIGPRSKTTGLEVFVRFLSFHHTSFPDVYNGRTDTFGVCRVPLLSLVFMENVLSVIRHLYPSALLYHLYYQLLCWCFVVDNKQLANVSWSPRFTVLEVLEEIRSINRTLYP